MFPRPRKSSRPCCWRGRGWPCGYGCTGPHKWLPSLPQLAASHSLPLLEEEEQQQQQPKVAHRLKSVALLLTESVSALCVRACEAVRVRAQASAASKEELVTIGVPGALEALLATRDGLTR